MANLKDLHDLEKTVVSIKNDFSRQGLRQTEETLDKIWILINESVMSYHKDLKGGK
jgi:hypothetical protein